MRSLWWAMAVGILARMAVVAAQPAPFVLKRLEPSVMADDLNAGRGFRYEQYGAVYLAWKEPLYIVCLAGLTRWIGPRQWPLVALQGVFGVGAALAVAWLARLLLDDPVKATLAGVLAAANPFLVYYDTHVIHPLSLDAFLFLVVVGTILLATDHPHELRRALQAGAVMGVALWQRAALWAAGAGAWLAAIVSAPRPQRRVMSRNTVLWLCVSAIAIAPWLVRNERLLGRVVITTDSAHIFWLGNNPWSNGTYADAEGHRIIMRAEPALLARINGAPELAQQDAFFSEACRFIREHPGRFGWLVLRRLVAFVWFSPNAGQAYAAWEGAVYRAWYSVLLTLGIAGMALCCRRTTPAGRRRVLVLLAAVAGLAAVHSVMAINLKHRVPFELVLAIFAAESLTWCGSRFLHRS